MRATAACVLAACLVACGRGDVAHAGARGQATLRNANGIEVGRVTLEETPHGVLLEVALEGVQPGEHGFHVHEIGACAPTFDAAGGHFAPERRAHGFRAPDGPHAGDLPNLFVPDTGRLRSELFLPDVRLRTGPNPLLDGDGSAFVIHAGADDHRSPPAGAAGERVACGVIEAIEPT